MYTNVHSSFINHMQKLKQDVLQYINGYTTTQQQKGKTTDT